MSMSTSRRKQYHPNKFATTKESTSQGALMNGKSSVVENNNVKIKEEVEETTENKEHNAATIQPGSTFGPFQYSKREKNEVDDSDRVVELVDVHGQKHWYCLKDLLSYQWIQQLQLSSNFTDCNCVLRDDNHELKLTVLKPVASIKDFVVGLEVTKNILNGHRSSVDATSPPSSDGMPVLAPEKQTALLKNFMCNFCHTRFSNPRTLEAHQTFYCSKRDDPPNQSVTKNTQTKSTVDLSAISIDCSADLDYVNHSEPSTSRVMDSSPSLMLTNLANFMQSASPPVILLPCAYTDNDVMQIVGYPQTVIPVAVSRNLNIPMRPLILEEQLMNGIQMPGDSVLIEPQQHNVDTDLFKLSMAIKTTTGQINLLPSRTLQNLPVPRARSATINTKKTADKSLSPFQSTLHHNQSNVKNVATPIVVEKATAPVANEEIVHSAKIPVVSTVPQIRVLPNQILSTTAKSAAVAKAFPCPNCDVTFSSEKTLEGHLSFYCSANKNQDPKITRKLIENQRLCCQFCDCTTSTTTELLQHVKLTHSALAKSAFNCVHCSYKGHSLRGIKSHLKYAHPNGTAETCAKTVDSSDTDRKSHSSSSTASTPKSYTDQDHDEPDLKRRRATYPVVVEKPSSGQSPLNLQRDAPVSYQIEDQKTDNDQTGDIDLSPSEINEQTCSSPSLVKYQCEFCSYQSPYKGNVKRHVHLIHKNDSCKEIDE